MTLLLAVRVGSHAHFSYLCANIEAMMQTGVPPYDARRTLLTTGIFDYVMVARGEVRRF